MDTATKVKAALLRKMRARSNSIEVVDQPGARFVFDHATGNKMQFSICLNGIPFTQAWSNRGYSVEACYESYKGLINSQREFWQENHQ